VSRLVSAYAELSAAERFGLLESIWTGVESQELEIGVYLEALKLVDVDAEMIVHALGHLDSVAYQDKVKVVADGFARHLATGLERKAESGQSRDSHKRALELEAMG
jgi:hypothetical protein